jgi:hypothetical protein
MYSLAELQLLTERWSADRGITTNGKAITQVCKLTEEICETLEAMCDDDNDSGIFDGIGDSLVVCCNLNILINGNIAFKHVRPSKAINPIQDVFKSLSKLCKYINSNEYKKASEYLYDLISALYSLAEALETSAEHCWTLAYEEIKDRKGYLTVHGNFIKEADMQPTKQLTMDFDND